MRALGKKGFSVDTIYDALGVSVGFELNAGMTTAQEFVNDFLEYVPDYGMTPVVITPKAFITDPSGDSPYGPTTNIVLESAVTNIKWFRITNAGIEELTSVIGGDYTISTSGGTKGQLTMRKNQTPNSGRTLLFQADFLDSRTGLSQKISRSVTFTCTATTMTMLKSRTLFPKGMQFDCKFDALTMQQKIFLGNDELTSDVARWWYKDDVLIDGETMPICDPTLYNTVYNRIIADGGTVRNPKFLKWVLYANRRWLDKTEILYVPECGSKITDNKIEKLYNLSGTNDALQATAANRFFAGNLIALSEKASFKAVQGESGIKVYSYTEKQYLSTDEFSIILNIEPRFFGVEGIRLYLSSGGNTIIITTTSISVTAAYVESAIAFYAIQAGITSTLIIRYNGNSWDISVNGLSLPLSTNLPTAFKINQIYIDHTVYPCSFKSNIICVISKALSDPEAQSIYAFLSNEFTSIEAVTVGSQRIATSNLEATVFGGVTIPEVQSAIQTELITTTGDRWFSVDTGFWSKGVGVTINSPAGSLCKSDGSIGGFARLIYSTLANTKFLRYKVLINISDISEGSLKLYTDNWISPVISTQGEFIFITEPTLMNAFGISNFGVPFIGTINHISIVKLGWSDSQYIYDQRIIAGDTVLQANIAAAMWAHYDNSPANGAIYGKLYNSFAVPVINTYCPAGFHVPSNLEWTMISEYLGGDTVSGGKLKALYGGFNNAFATNESGVSLLAAGLRIDDGTFANISVGSYNAESIGVGSRNAYDDNTGLTRAMYNNKYSFAIRLFANTPFTEPVTSHLLTDTLHITAADANYDEDVKITCKAERITTATATEAQIAKIAAGLWRPAAPTANAFTESATFKYVLEDIKVEVISPSAVKSNVKMVNPHIQLSNNAGIITNPQNRFSFLWKEGATEIGRGSNIMVPLSALEHNLEVQTVLGMDYIKYKLTPDGVDDTLVIPFDLVANPVIRFIIDFMPSTLTGEKILVIIGNTTKAIKIFTNGTLLMIQTNTAQYAINTLTAERVSLDFTTNMAVQGEITAAKINGSPFAPDRSANAWAPSLTGIAKHDVADMIMFVNGSLQHRWTFDGADDATRKSDKISATISLPTTATFKPL